MSRRVDASRDDWAKLALGLSCFVIGAVVLAAHATPATDYEISVYAGTPIAFWLGIGVSLSVAVTVGVFVPTRRVRAVSLFLGGTAVIAVLLIPIVRGYYYLASADSMSHLGWIRDIATGALAPIDLFYPGFHVISVLIAIVTGAQLPRAAMLAVAAFALVFVLFVTLSVRALTPSSLGTVIGGISAFLFLPINVIVVKLAPHPISQASLYIALVFFLFVKFLPADREWDEAPADAVTAWYRWRHSSVFSGVFSGVGLLLLLALATLVLYHPQAAAMIFILFSTIALVQVVYRWWFVSSRLGSYRPMLVPTIFLGSCLGIWIGTFHPGLLDTGSRIAARVSEFLQGTGGGDAGEVVGQRGSSLQQIGGSLEEVFIKLFLVETVFVGLAVVLVILGFRNRLDEESPDLNAVTKALGFGFLVVGPWAALQFIGNISTLLFRYLGISMVVVTVLGAVTINALVTDERGVGTPTIGSDGKDPVAFDGGLQGDSTIRRASLVLVLFLILTISLATVFPSPFVYQPSMHVTEAQFEGYERTLDVYDESLGISNPGVGVWRYRHAVAGTTGLPWGGEAVPRPEYDHNLTGYLRNASGDGGEYLVVSEFDRVRADRVYNGLRFNQSDFHAVGTQPGVNRVLSNGDVELYLYASDARNRTAGTRRAGTGG
jgi:hypothetical protein